MFFGGVCPDGGGQEGDTIIGHHGHHEPRLGLLLLWWSPALMGRACPGIGPQTPGGLLQLCPLGPQHEGFGRTQLRVWMLNPPPILLGIGEQNNEALLYLGGG